MDIFGDDIDSLLRNDDDDNDKLNKNIGSEDDGEGNDENEDGEKKAESEPIKVEPKKRAVRNPQVSNHAVFSFCVFRGHHCCQK